MAIKPSGLTENAWTSRARVNRNWFQDIRRGANPKLKTLERVLEAIGITLAEFQDLPGQRKVLPRNEGASSAAAAEDILDLPLLRATPAANLNIGGASVAGIVSSMSLDPRHVVEYLRRPKALSGREDVYAIEVADHSMLPRFELGEPAYVSSAQRARPGEYLLIQLKRPEGDGHAPTIALLKRLVKQMPDELMLEQFDPKITFTLKTEWVQAMHRVIPWREIVFF